MATQSGCNDNPPIHARTNQGGFAGPAAPLALQQGKWSGWTFQGGLVNLAQKAGFDQDAF